MTYKRHQQDRHTMWTNLMNNRPTDMSLTKEEKRKSANHVKNEQPLWPTITSQLNWQMINNITTLSTNQDNNQRLVHWTDNSKLFYPFDSDDDFCSACQNVKPCQHKQFFSRLHSPRTIILHKLIRNKGLCYSVTFNLLFYQLLNKQAQGAKSGECLMYFKQYLQCMFHTLSPSQTYLVWNNSARYV